MTPRAVAADARSVAVIGGGLAGLAGAVVLCEHGYRVTLLEARPRLGGRASSFPDATSGELIDNCQHVSMGCCTNLADFTRRVGIDGLFRREWRLNFVGPDGRISQFGRAALPAPFHLLPGLLGARFLTPVEKLRVVYGMVRLLDAQPDDRTSFRDWLLRHGQTPRTIERLWSLVLVSALNELPEQMDVGQARKVFVEGFLRNPSGCAVDIPTAPLEALYGEVLRRWLVDRGVEVRLTTGVRSLELRAGRVGLIRLRSGESIARDWYLSAVVFDRLLALLPAELVTAHRCFADLRRFEVAPITSIHLWFDRPITPLAHAVLVGRTLQWMFNRTALARRSPGPEQYLQFVVSAAYEWARLDKAEVLRRTLGELRTIWPAVDQARLLRWRVVTEHSATFAPRPGVDRLRPGPRSPIPNLVLAGDWTATGWPATMEGAVRSGYRAAEAILAADGRPRRVLRPDLPATGLAALVL